MLVTIHKHNNLSIQIEANIEYVRSVRDYFSGFVDGYQFMPAFKNSAWDGKISLLDLVKKTLPYGLLIDLIKFHRKAYPDTEIKIDDDVLHLFRGLSTNIDYDLKFEPHYYQKDCIEAALKYKRGIIRSATASGKSLIIAHIIKTLMEHNLNKKALIIVPTISLVEQFYDDLLEYGYFTKDCLGKVYEKYKEFGRPVVISTWQTLSRNHNRLSEFECVICDEVHGAKAHEIKKILNLCTGADYRLGFTGTMPLSDLDIWNVKAYLGPVIREYGAGQLGREGYISKANIVIVDINYQNEYKGSYDDVKDEIFKNPFRLGVLKNIINASKGNILLLVGKVEKEGALLKEYLDKQTDHNALKKDVVFLHGSTKVQEREYWRKECEKRKNIVLIATYGIFQQGINIPSLKYIVLASPYKSKIRVLQSIGRGLRKHKSKKDGAYIYDIFDDCKYLYDHGVKRERHYNAEGFDVTDIVLQEGEHIDPSLFKV